MLDLVCSYTEMQPLLTGVTVTHDPHLELPFTVDRRSRIMLGDDAFRSLQTCAVLTRHALEVVALQRLTDDDSALDAATLALFACRTAALYKNRDGHGPCGWQEAALPTWLQDAYSACDATRLQHTEPAELIKPVTVLLPLQGAQPTMADRLTPVDWQVVANRIRDSHATAGPTEFLLTSGGDTRLEVDPATGQSRYGCRCQPVTGLASFGSSTATTVTPQNFAVAEQARQRLLESVVRTELHEPFAQEMDALKRQILAFCGADDLPQTDVLLCSSGTDAELYAVCLAAEQAAGRLTTVVIAPDETGTGVPAAAAGRHFSSRTPLGVPVGKGERLAGCAGSRLDVLTIEARDVRGTAASAGAAGSGHAAGRGSGGATWTLPPARARCVENRMGRPSLPLVRKLTVRHAGRLTVVVDACQMRVGRQALGGYLREGFLLQVTGSKSFGGPPFCVRSSFHHRWLRGSLVSTPCRRDSVTTRPDTNGRPRGRSLMRCCLHAATSGYCCAGPQR